MNTNFRRHHLTKAAFLLLGLLIFNLLAVGCGANQGQQISSEAQLVAEVDLSTQPHDAEVVGEFSLAETAVVTLTYTMPNVDTAVFDLSLNGPNDDYVILHSEGYRTDENGGGSWEQNLAPGTYQLVLTASQTSGTLSVYWESE